MLDASRIVYERLASMPRRLLDFVESHLQINSVLYLLSAYAVAVEELLFYRL